MLQYLNHIFKYKFFISLFIFNFLLKEISSISGTDSEIFDLNDTDAQKPEKDEDTLCPCDMTNECDIGCICDSDCLDLMLSNDFFNKFEWDESSYAEKNKYTKLDYCDDYKESVDDLYNPLVLAFKILKRGFCSVKDNKKDDEEGDKEDYDKYINNYEAKDNKTINIKNNDNYIEDYFEGENQLNKFDDKENFEPLNISLPLALPSGLCLFNSHRLKKNIDYEVTCSYNSQLNKSIAKELGEDIANNSYYIHDYYYDNQSISNTYYIKKVEIFYYINGSNYSINHYYEEADVNVDFIDLTVDVKFVLNESDFKLSGNPGYIKGKNLIFRIKDDTTYNTYIQGVIFPIEKINGNRGDRSDDKNIYFDNYFDNKITFEDLIIYGYKDDSFKSIIEEFLNQNPELAEYGNVNGNNYKSIDNIGNGISDNKILIVEYKNYGSVNNTQNQIYKIHLASDEKINEHKSYNYLIIKFVKLETETTWFYARSPVIVKLPRNIMYPFRIGTSNYK